jgi:hypothetical protein
LHDGSNFDLSGIPAVIVATTAFTQAAEVQSKALGYTPSMVWVPHPIQDRTDEELGALADQHCEAIVQAITAAP